MTRVRAFPGNAASYFGERSIENKLPHQYAGSQGNKVIRIDMSYDDLPTYGTDESILAIPANAHIVKATFRVTEAFAGGTSYNIGLYEEDSTVIDADGIDAAVALAAINAVGETVLCDGALVGNTAGIGTAAGQVVFAATGTFTAGRGYLEVEYTLADDRASSN